MAKRTKKWEDEKAKVISILSSHGWSKTEKAELSYAAEMEYEGKFFSLEVEYFAMKEKKEDGIALRFFYGDGELFLFIFFKDKLEDLLQLIASFQDDISEDTYKGYIKKIMEICPDIYIETDEGTYPLTDDEDDSSE